MSSASSFVAAAWKAARLPVNSNAAPRAGANRVAEILRRAARSSRSRTLSSHYYVGVRSVRFTITLRFTVLSEMPAAAGDLAGDRLTERLARAVEKKD